MGGLGRESRVTGKAPWPVVDMLLATAVGLGLLDVLLALLGKPWSLRGLDNGVPAFAATQWLGLAAGVAVWLLALLAVRDRGRRLGVVAGACLGLLVLFVGARLAGVMPVGGGHDTGFIPTDAVRWLFLLGIAAVAFMCGRLAVLRYHVQGMRPQWPRVAFGLPLFLCLLLAFVWLQVYHVESVRSPVSIALTVGTGLGFALLGLACWRFETAGLWRLVYAFVILSATALAFLRSDTVPMPLSARSVEGASPRNVFLIIVDTLRADAVGALGGHLETPNLDALAADSVVFSHAVAPAPWTLPSVASILTGVPPRAHGMVQPGGKLASCFATLAECFQDAGYVTAGIGHNPHLLPASGLDRGFDWYCWFPRWAYDTPTLGAALLEWIAPVRFAANPTTAELVDLAAAWCRQHQTDASFLWLHILDPHGPYTPPAAYWPAGPPPLGFSYEFDAFDRVRMGYLGKTGDERDWIRGLYEAEVRCVDAEVGRLLAELKALGLYEDALIVLASDHGEQFWEHGGIEHGATNYQEEIHVPLMIKLPDGASGTVRRVVPLAGLGPTLLELAGIAGKRLHGGYGSFAGLLKDDVSAVDTPPVLSWNSVAFEPSRAVTFGRHKYLRWLVTGREEVYDLETDPGEQRPLDEGAGNWLGEGRRMLAEADQADKDCRAAVGLPPLAAQPLAAPEPIPEAAEALRALGYIE